MLFQWFSKISLHTFLAPLVMSLSWTGDTECLLSLNIRCMTSVVGVKTEDIVIKDRYLEKRMSGDLLVIDFVPRELVMSRIRASA